MINQQTNAPTIRTGAAALIKPNSQSTLPYNGRV
jgi:hypothetical protein